MSARWAPPLEVLPEFICTIARDGTILYINRTMTRPTDQVIGQSIDTFIDPSARDQVHRLIREVFETKEVRTFDVPLNSSSKGAVFQTTYLPLFQSDGGVQAVVSISRNVTEQRQAEALLTQRQGLLQALLQVFPDMVFRLSSDGVILDFIGDPESTFVPPKVFLQRSVETVLPPRVATRMLEAVGRAVREQEIVTLDYELTKNDETRYFEARMIRLGEDDVLAIVRDRTVQRLMEQRLLQADRIASLGTLAAGVAHEINNPLTYVIGNLTLASRELAAISANGEVGARVHEVQKALADARAGADRVRYIASDLNNFSAPPGTDLSLVDLRKVLDSSINMAWSQIRHRARLVREYDDCPGVLGNENRLGQVFLNLLMNAAQAIEEGDAQKNIIYVRTLLDGSFVMVLIRDTGRGFDPVLASRIFDPFFTTKPTGGGTGLGLAICRSIIGFHGGEVTAVSDGPGRGATFTVRLPAAAALPEVRPVERVPLSEDDPVTGRVLVVDDEPVMATLARRALAGHEVYVVTSGRDALELCRDQEFDVILCDLLMPDVTGMDLYESLVSDGKGVESRIVFMTAGAFTPRARAFLSQVVNAHLEKPFDLDELAQAVQRALRDRQRAGPRSS